MSAKVVPGQEMFCACSILKFKKDFIRKKLPKAVAVVKLNDSRIHPRQEDVPSQDAQSLSAEINSIQLTLIL